MKLKPIDITLAAVFAALMAVGANLTSLLVIGSVPITLQTFFSVLAGMILGSRLGAISMTVYAVIGLAGAPVFAQFSGGFGMILKPTFGFILSFILVAYITGKIVESNSSKKSYLIAALVGMVINYAAGTNWMFAAMKVWADAPEGFTYKMAWGWMLAPLPKDILLSVCAGLIAPRLNRTLSKTSRTIKKSAA
ncbi:biotin transporter BioY [Pseudalkalibacillus salsuginis]|uniref:biotin transporter BioY n=1 Tax=Pseudalkalibacillus salsuginis TaxID=2910972 RepID=UPI001F185CB7|nr:biotin transporter BioY [Pseudalkalibacillus salsuginis]MCF6409385.1 biotin transporter BioY [Pseudalkalibacillus salsuginis]